MNRKPISAIVFVCIVGCGSSSSDSGLPGDGGSPLDASADLGPPADSGPTETDPLDGFVPDHTFAKAYAHGLCDGYDKCCAVAGKTEDHAACESFVEDFISKYVDPAMARGDVVVPSKLAGCTEALSAATGQCTDYLSVSTKGLLWQVEVACWSAFVGTSAVGAPCAVNPDCVQTAGSNTACVFYSGSSGSGVLCQQEVAAGLGEDCVDEASVGHEPVVHVCDPTQPLLCVGGKCVKRPGVGEACIAKYYASCDLADRCDGTICGPRFDAGATCANDADCKAGLHCATSTKTCVPLAEIGETCATAADCASNECSGGQCALHDSFFALGLPSSCK